MLLSRASNTVLMLKPETRGRGEEQQREQTMLRKLQKITIF